MNAAYTEYLQQQLKEAIDEFNQAKASALQDLKDLDPYHAQDWGAGYYTKIDKVTAAGTKVRQWDKAYKTYIEYEEKGNK